MANPKDTAAALVGELETALATLSMPPLRRQELEELLGTARHVATVLATFHEQYVLLDLRDEGRAFDDAYRQWESLDAGALAGNQLERLVTLSQPLRRLDRAGINILGIKKFSAAESRFAKLLGDNFAGLGRSWDGLKKVASRSQPDLRFQRDKLAAARQLLECMAALDLFTVNDFQAARTARDDDGRSRLVWDDVDVGNLPNRIGGKSLLRARLVPTGDNSARSLFTGEWLNAYAAELVHDHLRRNDMAHEIYTNVRYAAPREIIDVSGDFDVIVQSGDTIAVFECKSGTLDVERGDLRSVIDKADGLHRVIKQTGSEVTLVPLLLFNPSASDREKVEAALAGTGIQALTPGEVRGVTTQLFRSA